VSRAEPVQGWWALIPVAGTFALLAAGPTAWVSRCVLAQPVLRFYGAISWPLFLWHWPLLSFPAVMGAPLTIELRVIILAASVALATLTHLAFEPQAQSVAGWTRRSAGLAACLVITGLVGSVSFIAGGFPASFPDGHRASASSNARTAPSPMDELRRPLADGPPQAEADVALRAPR